MANYHREIVRHSISCENRIKLFLTVGKYNLIFLVPSVRLWRHTDRRTDGRTDMIVVAKTLPRTIWGEVLKVINLQDHNVNRSGILQHFSSSKKLDWFGSFRTSLTNHHMHDWWQTERETDGQTCRHPYRFKAPPHFMRRGSIMMNFMWRKVV